MSGPPVIFTPLPILLACPVPVTPDGRTVDEDGDPLPEEQRTARCAVWAHWMVGLQVSCDVHTEIMCRLAEIDFDDLVREAGRNPLEARVPWAERIRSTQEDAEQTECMMRQAAT
jgi:hypothetical protein